MRVVAARRARAPGAAVHAHGRARDAGPAAVFVASGLPGRSRRLRRLRVAYWGFDGRAHTGAAGRQRRRGERSRRMSSPASMPLASRSAGCARSTLPRRDIGRSGRQHVRLQLSVPVAPGPTLVPARVRPGDRCQPRREPVPRGRWGARRPTVRPSSIARGGGRGCWFAAAGRAGVSGDRLGMGRPLGRPPDYQHFSATGG